MTHSYKMVASLPFKTFKTFNRYAPFKSPTSSVQVGHPLRIRPGAWFTVFSVIMMPDFSWQDLFSSLIERTEQMKTISNLPLLFLDLRESKRLLSQHLRDVNEIATPFDLAVIAHAPNRGGRAVFNGWNFPRVTAWRDTINTPRRLSSQRFMRALPVILLQEEIKMVLLTPLSWLRRDILFKSAVHPFMTAVLARLSRLDPLGADAELDPPLRQLTEPAHGQRSKGGSVISANRLGQAILAKRPLKPGSDGTIAGMLQGPAHQQVTRKVVTQRERMTAPMVAQSEIALEVRTPDLIGSLAIAKRLAIRPDMGMSNSRFNQARPLKNLTRRGIGRPDQLRAVLTQVVEHFFRAPTLAIKLGLDQHLHNFLTALIGMSVRGAGVFVERLNSTLLIALDPFVGGRTTDPISSTPLKPCMIMTETIRHKQKSLSHGAGLFPRHWLVAPFPCVLNCKPCARFVL